MPMALPLSAGDDANAILALVTDATNDIEATVNVGPRIEPKLYPYGRECCIRKLANVRPSAANIDGPF
jgi:hypothetical protein